MAMLAAVDDAIARLATTDPSVVTERDLERAVRRLGRLGGQLEGVQARFVAAAEKAGLPERSGAGSTTSWIARQTGRSGGQAARTGRLAKSTDHAPELADAVAAGKVGPDQANTLASGLDRGELEPDDLDELLPIARRHTPEMFRRAARRHAGRRRQERLRNQELVARQARTHRQWRTPDGSLRYEGQLPPAEGDLLEKAISAFHQPDSADVPDELRRTHAQRNADAMTGLLGAALRNAEAGSVGGIRPHVTVTVPYQAMAPLADAEAAGVTATTDAGTVLSAAAFTKLACDATFRRLVLEPEGAPRDIGRATRIWPAAMRTAIAAVDGGCRGPGCDLPPDRCIVHHVTWWSDRGETSVTNGALLCNRHHDLVHDDGWDLRMDPATRACTWVGPSDGPTHAPGTTIVTQPRGSIADDCSITADDATGAARAVAPGRPLGRGDPVRPRDPNAARRASRDHQHAAPTRGDPLRPDL